VAKAGPSGHLVPGSTAEIDGIATR
jgi:hypothetical protein